MKSSSSVNQLAKGLLQTTVGFAIALTAAPAFADNASVSGAVSYTTPAGFSTSISAEKVAPTGYNFTGNVTVTITPGGANGSPLGMTLNGGDLAAINTAPPSYATLKSTVITTLSGINTTTQAGLDQYAAILKAAAGANGLE
jgi:hypothetical protein